MILELLATLSRYCHCAFMHCDQLYVEDDHRTPRHTITLMPLCIYVLRRSNTAIDCTSRMILELFATLSRYCHCAFMHCDRLYVEDDSRTLRHPLPLLPLCIYVLRRSTTAIDCTSR